MIVLELDPEKYKKLLEEYAKAKQNNEVLKQAVREVIFLCPRLIFLQHQDQNSTLKQNIKLLEDKIKSLSQETDAWSVNSEKQALKISSLQEQLQTVVKFGFYSFRCNKNLHQSKGVHGLVVEKKQRKHWNKRRTKSKFLNSISHKKFKKMVYLKLFFTCCAATLHETVAELKQSSEELKQTLEKKLETLKQLHEESEKTLEKERQHFQIDKIRMEAERKEFQEKSETFESESQKYLYFHTYNPV